MALEQRRLIRALLVKRLLILLLSVQLYPCLLFYFIIFIQHVHVSKTIIIIYPSQNMQRVAVLTKLQPKVFQAVHTY